MLKSTLQHREWVKNNKEKEKAIQKRFQDKFKKENSLSYIAAWNRKCRNAFLDMYGRQCACCSESIEGFLTIEHKMGRQGRKHKNSQEYRKAVKSYRPDLYETLCMNCNHAKGKFGYCPHKNKG